MINDVREPSSLGDPTPYERLCMGDDCDDPDLLRAFRKGYAVGTGRLY